MSRFLDRLSRLYRELGTADASLVIVARALETATGGYLRIRRYYLFSQPVAAIPAMPPRRGTGIRVREIGPDDAALAGFPRPPGEIAARFASGAHCLVAEVDGEVAGFLWYALDTWDDPETDVLYRLHPSQSTAWDFDVYVAPEHRIGFVFYKLWSETADRFRSHGITQSASLVWTHNEESVRSHRKLGAFPVGSALHLAVGRSVLHIADRPPRFTCIRPEDPSPQFDVYTGPEARKRYRRFTERRSPT